MQTQTEETEIELLKKRAKFVDEKTQLQMQLVEINQLCCTRIPNGEFRRLQENKAHILRRVANCEQWLAEIKGKLACIRVGKEEFRKHPTDIKIELQEELRIINEKWFVISKDDTKPLNERGLVALFVNDINKIKNKASKL